MVFKKKEVVEETTVKTNPAIYYRLVKDKRNYFFIETLTIDNGVTTITGTAPETLDSAFSKLRRMCGESYFHAIQNND
jgi:hypothetical protein